MSTWKYNVSGLTWKYIQWLNVLYNVPSSLLRTLYPVSTRIRYLYCRDSSVHLCRNMRKDMSNYKGEKTKSLTFTCGLFSVPNSVCPTVSYGQAGCDFIASLATIPNTWSVLASWLVDGQMTFWRHSQRGTSDDCKMCKTMKIRQLQIYKIHNT